jgi:hypothetical protein
MGECDEVQREARGETEKGQKGVLVGGEGKKHKQQEATSRMRCVSIRSSAKHL